MIYSHQIVSQPFLVYYSLLISLETKRGGSLSSGPPLGGMTLAQADRQTTAVENIIFSS